MIRPLKPKAKTILKVAIPLAVVAFVLFLWANARPVPIQVRVTFTSFTNPATLLLTHAFCVSNAGRCSLLESRHRIEIKNKPQDGFLELGWLGELKPGEFKTISLEPSPEILLQSNPPWTNLEPWRLTLSFSKLDWREELVRNPPSVGRTPLRFVPMNWLVSPPIEVHSDWINGPPALMPVATSTTNTPPK